MEKKENNNKKFGETEVGIELLGDVTELTNSALDGDADDGNPDDYSNYAWKKG